MIAALIASHNRRLLTSRCIRSVFDAGQEAGVEIQVYLVDDGSDDGTPEWVTEQFPRVHVLHGDGRLFWAGGMRRAELAALSGSAERLLWLNNDVQLFRHAVRDLIDAAGSAGRDSIVVGAVCDPDTGGVAYSGLRRIGRHPLHYQLIDPRDRGQNALVCDAFNGNVVLMHRAVAERVGGIDSQLVHRAADIDFALRATAHGVRSVLAARFVGTCRRSSPGAPWLDHSLPYRVRAAALRSPLGVPPRASARFLRRHGGIAWPIVWLTPYLRFAASLVPVVGRCVPAPEFGPRAPGAVV